MKDPGDLLLCLVISKHRSNKFDISGFAHAQREFTFKSQLLLNKKYNKITYVKP